VALVALLTDRSPLLVLPALADAAIDVKVEHLSVALIDHVLAFAPELVLVDAAENAGQGYAVLRALRDRDPVAPVVGVLERGDLDRFAWEEVADEILFTGAPAAEIRVRIAMLRRVFTRPTLLREVWGYDFYGGTRTVDVHVRRLRAKLGPEHEDLIETVRGVGYRAQEA
jgi:DNA-binding response OmpR family regulator